MYRYHLEKGSKKHHCPSCGKKRLVRYIDSETGSYLPPRFGRCDREVNCGYHQKPTTDRSWQAKPPPPRVMSKGSKAPLGPSPLPMEVLQPTLGNYAENGFLQYLLQAAAHPFTVADVEQLVALYRLGTLGKGPWAGATTFPFIDVGGTLRAVQVKQFDRHNHTTATTFLHSLLASDYRNRQQPLPAWLKTYQQNERKVSCLFGEHLPGQYPQHPIALVEAPKTALYGTLYFGFPQVNSGLLWLAVYNLSSFNHSRCRVLQGRQVLLFPDLSKDGSALRRWKATAQQLNNSLVGTRFSVSTLLERDASPSDRQQGNDLADYLIRQPWQPFRQMPPVLLATSRTSVTIYLSRQLAVTVVLSLAIGWNKHIIALERHFALHGYATAPHQLNACSTITDTAKFVASHLAMVKGNKRYWPYLERLHGLKNNILKEQVNG